MLKLPCNVLKISGEANAPNAPPLVARLFNTVNSGQALFSGQAQVAQKS